MKKTVGIIEGEHPSFFKGVGRDFADFKLYEVGDDTKHIDWKSSAKNGQIVIKRFILDANTNMCLLIDSGRQLLTRSSAGERKIDIVQTICDSFAYLSNRRMDGVSIIAGDDNRIMNERNRLSFGEIKVVLDKISQMANINSPKSNYLRVLQYANQSLQKRTFIVLVFNETEFYTDYKVKIAQIRRLKQRHDIFAISLRNINPFAPEPPKISGKMVDIETKNYVPAFFRSKEVSNVLDKEIAKQRNTIRQAFKALNIPLICAKGSKDFVKQLRRRLQREEVQHF